ncbi:MAG: hypothetical protein RIS47_2128 [Bacteroidota bacterium]|jgi:DNA gyrase subunit A
MENKLNKEVLVFTNLRNVYKLYNTSMFNYQQVLTGAEMEVGEHAIYVTGTDNFDGFLLTAYETGKVAKVSLASFKSETKRKRLKNAYSGASKLIYIAHFETDTDLVAISSIGKVLLFNTSDINTIETPSAQGVQVLKSKDLSKLDTVEKPGKFNFANPEFYRKNIPAIGYFLHEADKDNVQL